MRTSAQLLVNFLFNAVWQIAVIALAAALADRFLRATARLRHIIWVAALLMSLILPLGTAVSLSKSESALPAANSATTTEPVVLTRDTIIDSTPQAAAPVVDASWQIAQRTAAIVVVAFGLLVLYRSGKLFQAWLRTRTARRGAQEIDPGADVLAIVDRCREVFGGARCRIFSSQSLRTPATVGVFRPLIILPEELLREADLSALTAAIGHEVVHIARRDYLLNLIYEVLFLPVSFHPAAVFIKRRLIQTRELRCDELVAERLLHPEVYARSLVRIASWAMPGNRRTQTIVVGIADADILEVRIMSLLKKNKSTFRRNALLVFGAVILLAIPGVAAASFGFKFNIDPGLSASAQEPSAEEKQKRELLRTYLEKNGYEAKRKLIDADIVKLKMAIEQAPNEADRRTLAEMLKKVVEERETASAYSEVSKVFDARLSQEGQRKREFEEKYKTEMVRQAKISMDHAIQIATSKIPGKVLECTIVGERWSADGESSKPGVVLYRVVILSGDEPPVSTFVWVNSADGSIYRTEKKEERRKLREEEQSFERSPARQPINGGVLNGRATSLPVPEYPVIARQAQASGAVTVEVLINEGGAVVGTQAVSGHPLLRAAAEGAAREAKFAPTRLQGEPVMVRGTIVYNFVAQ